jgi:hypothetical protein
VHYLRSWPPNDRIRMSGNMILAIGTFFMTHYIIFVCYII